MPMRVFAIFVVAIATAGCGLQTRSAAGADFRRTHGDLTATISKVVRSNGQIDLEWRICNRGPGHVWIPQAWGLDDERDFGMPVSFLAPPADLMVCFLIPSQSRLHQNLEGTAHWKCRCLETGETVSGRMTLKLPLEIQQELLSPFQQPPGMNTGSLFVQGAKPLTFELRALSGLQLAVQYWMFDPNGRETDFRTDPLWRIYVANSLARGDDNYRDHRLQMLQQWALSERVELEIPLAKAVSLLN